MALCPGLPWWAGSRKVKPIWILLKQETVSGSGISWVICKSAPRSRQITMPAPHHWDFYRPDALPAPKPTAPKHWRLSWRAYAMGNMSPMLLTPWQDCVCMCSVHSRAAESVSHWTSTCGRTCEFIRATGRMCVRLTRAARSLHSRRTSSHIFSHMPNRSTPRLTVTARLSFVWCTAVYNNTV